MSSLQKTKSGTYRIQFRSLGRQQSVSLGKCRKTAAETFQLHVDRLLSIAKGIEKLTPVDTEWIAGLSRETHNRLKAAGVIQTEATQSSFTSAVDDFVETMTTWGQSTQQNWTQHRRRVWQYFANRPFSDITAGAARDFKQFMIGDLGLSENTARKTIASCRQVFQWLIDHERAAKNPFAGQPVGISKAVHQDYVPVDRVERILAHAPTRIRTRRKNPDQNSPRRHSADIVRNIIALVRQGQRTGSYQKRCQQAIRLILRANQRIRLSNR